MVIMHYVYVLKCINGTEYVGCTNDSLLIFILFRRILRALARRMNPAHKYLCAG